jgi:8-oxo-dGTP pyrophosphatase MutT (NUDIX family)
MQCSRFEQRLTAALKLEIPYPERALGDSGIDASVLILFGYPQVQVEDGEPLLLLTLRTEHVARHKGQVAFPGGVRDPYDRDAIATAMRETEEEVGIPSARVVVLGTMPPFCTVTGYRVTPVIGILNVPIEEFSLRLNEHEIAETFWVPFSTLLESGVYRSELYHFRGADYPIHVYEVNGRRIWGATGTMLKNLLDRLAALG